LVGLTSAPETCSKRFKGYKEFSNGINSPQQSVCVVRVMGEFSFHAVNFDPLDKEVVVNEGGKNFRYNEKRRGDTGQPCLKNSWNKVK